MTATACHMTFHCTLHISDNELNLCLLFAFLSVLSTKTLDINYIRPYIKLNVDIWSILGFEFLSCKMLGADDEKLWSGAVPGGSV